MRKKKKGILFVLPSLIGVLLFYIAPFLVSFMYCFTEGTVRRKFVGIENFKSLFQMQQYRLAIKNTTIIVGIALPLLLIISLLVTLIIEKSFVKFKGLQVILLIPMVLPTASMMLVWQDMFCEQGLINYVLRAHVDWLHAKWAPLLVIGLIIWKNTGYNVLLLMSSLTSMPKEYEEAASLEGCGFWRIAKHIKIPYLSTVLFFCSVISLLNCFKIFREVYLLQGDYPNENLYMLQHFMNSHFINLDYEVLAAAAFMLYMVIFAVIYIAGYLQQRYS